MEFVATFLLSVLSATGESPPGRRKIYIVVRRPYAYLEEGLRRAFEAQEDVKVIVDRRYDERRTSTHPAPVERRRAHRRHGKEEPLEIVIEGRLEAPGGSMS